MSSTYEPQGEEAPIIEPVKSERFAFLGSNRFWAVVIGAVSLFLFQEGIITEPVFALIGTITTAFVGIRTVDKFSEK